MSSENKPTVLAEAEDEKIGVEHEKLEGWVPPLASDAEICTAFEKAFDYRGDVTITLKTEETIDGYIFDRHTDPAGPAASYVRMFPRNQTDKRVIHYADIARLEFTGRDTAAGKSFETWVRKYNEKKAAGEKGIRIDPEALD